MDIAIWLAAALVLAVIEIMTLDLIALMLSGGAVAAAIGAAVGLPVPLQVVVMAAAAMLLVLALRPWLLTRVRQRTVLVETNAAALVGATATVVTTTGQHSGRVKLAGEVWSATTTAPGPIEVGTTVTVVRIDGATAVVVPAEPGQHPQPTSHDQPPTQGAHS